MYIDMHVHSCHSDGGKSVKELITIAKENDVKILSITDHCNIEAYKEAELIKTDLEIILGIEIDVCDKGKNYHFLMYGFNPDNELFKNYLNDVKKFDENRFYENIKLLKENFDININKNEIEKFIGENNYLDTVKMNRLLVLNNFADSERDAFYKYTNILPKYKRYEISFEELNKISKDAGGILVLAHPNKYTNNNLAEEAIAIIEDFRKRGLKGLEVFSNKASDSDEEKYLKYAQDNKMLISGGSDYHAKYGANETKKIGEVRNKKIKFEELNILKEVVH